jgi:uncharacterized protein
VEEIPARFAADRMLKRLARWLRLIGADVVYDDCLSGAEMLRRARSEERPLLTRDKRLRTAPDVLCLESQLFRDQLREVMRRYPFDPHRFAFTRCLSCNEPLQMISREVVARRIPPFVFATHEHFALCASCNRVYWGGTHPVRALSEIKALGL